MQYDTTINQWHTCPNSGRINASNPCVTGDTRVLTPGGIWRRIDQMIHLPARIVTNLPSEGDHGQSKQIHFVEGAFPTGTKEVFELKTAGGYSLKLTADHKVWTRSRGWVEAQHLTLNDELRLMSEPACVEEVGEPVDAKLFQLAGLLISEANNSLLSLTLDRVLGERCADQIEGFAGYVNETWGTAEVAGEINGNATITTTLTNRRLLSRIGAFVRIERDLVASTSVRRLGDDAFTSRLRGAEASAARPLHGRRPNGRPRCGPYEQLHRPAQRRPTPAAKLWHPKPSRDESWRRRSRRPRRSGLYQRSRNRSAAHGLRIDEASLRVPSTNTSDF